MEVDSLGEFGEKVLVFLGPHPTVPGFQLCGCTVALSMV